ncbi:MAG: NAD(P)-dependent oxidoreductase [Caldilineaceae bacterium]|nr:NAD(P)-dependent oxidoreductase [Caldilineaceae bacterium]HRJ42573.1 NAD(P)-dependent oxidoreductase [Caldilineaceae bacterium]
MQNVLVTGAAGRIGSAFRAYAADRYHFRLADRNIDGLEASPQSEVVRLEIADLDDCRAACRGIDTVLHLAADPGTGSGFYESYLDNNVKGVYNIFEAAREAGCRRVVYASSVQAIEGYPLDAQALTDGATRPLNIYGACKVFGESIAHVYAHSHGLSSIAVRIGSFEHNQAQFNANSRNLSTFVSARDLCQLFVRCIEAENVQFAILHGVSDNRFKRMDLSTTRQTVGYQPQDDAFVKYGIGLVETARWLAEHPRGEGE